MSPLARMFGAMISGFAAGVAIAAVIVFALMMWMSRPKAPERATVEPPSAPLRRSPRPRGSPASPLSREQFANNRRMRCATLPPRLRCCLP